VFFTAVGPIQLLFFWRYTIRHLNRNFARPEVQSMIPVRINMSIEWCAIAALLAIPFFMVMFSSS
jgi:hypothetical protein